MIDQTFKKIPLKAIAFAIVEINATDAYIVQISNDSNINLR